MKKIGILGGMSWPSTIEYYRIINQRINEALGGNHSAQIILYSVDFAAVEKMQKAGRWEELGSMLALLAKRFLPEADVLVIATNTMHKVAEQIEQVSGKKVLHIGDVTARAVKREQLTKVGLLGTRFTMQENFYKDRLRNYEIEVAVPELTEINQVDGIIYDELVKGVISVEAKNKLENIIRRLVEEKGCQGIIRGCTELPLLFDEDQEKCCGVPLFNTTNLHAAAAADYALLQSV